MTAIFPTLAAEEREPLSLGTLEIKTDLRLPLDTRASRRLADIITRVAEIRTRMDEMWPSLTAEAIPELVKLDHEVDVLEQQLEDNQI